LLWCPSTTSWSCPCGGLFLLDLIRLDTLLPPCSSFLAALLLLLISLWWSSKWPWSLIAWARIFVVISGMILGVLEVRWLKGMVCVVWCGCPWCLSSPSAQLVFAMLTFWSKPRLWCLSLFGSLFVAATCISGCANITDLAKWIFRGLLILLNWYHVKYEFNIIWFGFISLNLARIRGCQVIYCYCYLFPNLIWLPDSKMPINSSVWIMDPFPELVICYKWCPLVLGCRI
jgi:hypothetical protein